MAAPPPKITRALVEEALHRLWIEEPEARLRAADRKKAEELLGLLREMEQMLRKLGGKPKTLVDAAAGKAYAGLLAAELLLGEREEDRVISIEREPARVVASRRAAGLCRTACTVECCEGEVGDARLWPESPSLVVGLHACGGASDEIIARVIAHRARALLLVPCCTGHSVHEMARAEALAEALSVPKQAVVRRRFLQSVVDSVRALRLEAAGYRTEVVEFVGPSVTPHNVLFRAAYTEDAGRRERAEESLVALFAPLGWR